MSEKRRGLGRGLGALIPTSVPASPADGDRPADIFLPGRERALRAAPSAAHLTADVLPHDSPARDGIATAAGLSPSPWDGLPGSGRDAVPPGPDADGTELLPVPGARFAEIPVDRIVPNPRQPRQVFDEDAMAELVHSVREIGVLQPVVVRRVEDQDDQPCFELIMGERRWRASQQAALDRIPAIVRDTSDDVLLRDALLENLHRAQLNPLEEAAAYQQLLDDFGCTHEELATRIGRSRPQISNTIRLLRLPPGVQRRVAAGILSAGHARALLGLEDPAGMERLAQRIVAEGLSVRAVEEIVALGETGGTAAAKRRPRAGRNTSELDELASRLGDRLETRVCVSLGRNRGRLSIDFASVEDLNRIVDLLSPEVRKAFQSG